MSINATLLIQMLVFFIGAAVTMKFIWPPLIKALEERQQKITDGLAAADRAKADLAAAERRVEAELKSAREGASEVRAGAERQAAQLIEEARAEASRIVTAARTAAEEEAQLAAQRVKDQLRAEVATLAVSGASRILRREVDAAKHAELLSNLKNELQ